MLAGHLDDEGIEDEEIGCTQVAVASGVRVQVRHPARGVA